jgi:hypothetical protein
LFISGKVVEQVFDGIDAALGQSHVAPLANAQHITLPG